MCVGFYFEIYIVYLYNSDDIVDIGMRDISSYCNYKIYNWFMLVIKNIK